MKKPVTFESEGYTVVPGYYIATLLSCLNSEESIIKDGASFNPKLHYRDGKLATDGVITPGCEVPHLPINDALNSPLPSTCTRRVL